MTPSRLLIANRGEIAIRIAASARELGWHTIAVASADDASSLHLLRADEAHSLHTHGPAAYLDIDALLRVAHDAGADALHPGYGFLSENPELCRRCAESGIAFVGPNPELLALLGDKTRALSLARELAVPVLSASDGAVDAAGARAFADELRAEGDFAIILKAVDGGGGRGMRVVLDPTQIEDLHARAASEAQAAFGSNAIYAERLLPNARHVEVQILGDGQGGVIALGERECTLQRNHQKLVEMAPAPGLTESLRERIVQAALRMARHVRFRSLCTFEFLLDADTLSSSAPSFYFIEANPRLQVEHTVTEQVLGLDLVRLQLEVARGKSLLELGLDPAEPPRPRGHAVQLRINMERVREDGSPEPATGTLRAFVPPAGPGVRVDSFAYAGFAPSPRFDSLLAKLVVHTPEASFPELLSRARRALAELQIEGIDTNRAFLAAVMEHPAVARVAITTRFLQVHAKELHARAAEMESARRVLPADRSHLDASGTQGTSAPMEAPLPPGHVGVRAPVMGTVVGLSIAPGDNVRGGQELMVLSAMKMEHVVSAPADGTLHALHVAPGDTVEAGQRVCELRVEGAELQAVVEDQVVDLDHIRADLQASIDRHAFGLDEQRAKAVEKRHARGHRTARENLADLIDAGSFVEYGALAVAAQQRRRSEQDLIERTPADGLVAGVASINAALFPDARTQCVVLSYDYMVLAGTQGVRNHAKKDRMFTLARESRLPLVLFAEGGGGRPGDTDHLGISLLDCMAFVEMGRLSGLVPLVGIVNGRCFAGNAALAGCCDVLIATRDANLGMGGPAMIEGGGLGIFQPEEVGPMAVQAHNGVVDVLVEDEAEAVAVAKRYLGYFQGTLRDFTCADQRRLRNVIPQSRLRVYDVRQVVDLLGDEGSVLELRGGFAPGMVTALMRVEGRPLGVIANNPLHLSGAIDAAAADKAARFMQLCDAHDLPLLFLCDTPGIMVGPEAEATGLVRHAARLFVTGASLTVPFLSIVLRKAYGLGAQAMAGGSFKVPFSMVSWPSGEFGPMGLEGAVKLGFRRELDAIEDPTERERALEKMIAAAYQHGHALNVAAHFELDDVIDPADSRRVIVNALRSAPPVPAREGKKRPCIDTW